MARKPLLYSRVITAAALVLVLGCMPSAVQAQAQTQAQGQMQMQAQPPVEHRSDAAAVKAMRATANVPDAAMVVVVTPSGNEHVIYDPALAEKLNPGQQLDLHVSTIKEFRADPILTFSGSPDCTVKIVGGTQYLMPPGCTQ